MDRVSINIVLKIDDGEVYHEAASIKHQIIDESHWNNINVPLKIKNISKHAQFKAYVHNNSNHSVYVDDFEVIVTSNIKSNE